MKNSPIAADGANGTVTQGIQTETAPLLQTVSKQSTKSQLTSPFSPAMIPSACFSTPPGRQTAKVNPAWSNGSTGSNYSTDSTEFSPMGSKEEAEARLQLVFERFQSTAKQQAPKTEEEIVEETSSRFPCCCIS